MIVNDAETVNMIMQSRGLVPDNILLQHHPLVDDAAQTEKDLQKQQAKEDIRRKQMFGNDDIPPGGE
jgi:hypothetical protein